MSILDKPLGFLAQKNTDMNNKKIYKWLQDYFPELQHRKIPKEKNRRDFDQFKLWLMSEKMDKHSRFFNES